MNEHREHPSALPRLLYYVSHSGSQATFAPEQGIRARDTQSYFPYPNMESAFVKSLQEHFNWGSSTPSPYISVMANKVHAENWALDCEARTNTETYVHEISKRKLMTSYVFKAVSLAEALHFQLPRRARNKSEYLVLHRIPRKAIVRSRSSIEIRRGKIALFLSLTWLFIASHILLLGIFLVMAGA